MIQLNRILVPVDFSEFSEQALTYGMELCEKFDAELHLIHVLEFHTTGTPQFAMGLAIPSRQEESMAEVTEELKKMPDPAWANDHKVIRSSAHGSPFVQIMQYAKENKIDLIVMATHGRTGLSHVFMGSVAENVVRQAPCPVLTVRKEGHQFVAT